MSARKKASKRPTTRAGRAAAAKKRVAPELMAAVGRAAKVRGLSARDIERLPDAQLKKPRTRTGNDFHIEGDEIKSGLGLPESLTSAEIRDLRHIVSETRAAENHAQATRLKTAAECYGDIKAMSPGRIVATDRAPGLLASVLDQLNVTHARIHDLTTRIESVADAHCGSDGKARGSGENAPAPSGRAYELLGAASSIHRALDALTEQVDRLNLL